MCKGIFRTRSNSVTQDVEDLGGSGRDEPGETRTSGCTQDLDMILHVKHRSEKAWQDRNLGEIQAIG